MSDEKERNAGPEAARARIARTGRNDPCPCDSGKKYKKCHLPKDEAEAAPPGGPPDPQDHVQNGWRLFEQRRPGAAEKEFRAALALDADLADARFGAGMSRMQQGDNVGARQELADVIKRSEPLAAELRRQEVKDASTRKDAQAYVRACHALGCLDYDQGSLLEALESLERVFAVDDGPLGMEARLVAGKTLTKLGRPAEAVPILEAAAKSQAGAHRAEMGLALAHLAAGGRAAAEQALGRALEGNPHFARGLQGRLRARVQDPRAQAAGSPEEAALYAQTYGDVWDDAAKKWIEETLAGRAKAEEKVAAPAAAEG